MRVHSTGSTYSYPQVRRNVNTVSVVPTKTFKDFWNNNIPDLSQRFKYGLEGLDE